MAQKSDPRFHLLDPIPRVEFKDCQQSRGLMNSEDDNILVLPIFPLELTLLPGEPQVLRIFEPRYKQMLDDCLLDDAPFGLCLIDPFNPVSGWAGPHHVGTTARITSHEEVGSNHMIEIQGQRRFHILNILEPSLPPMDPVQHRVFPDLESLLELVDEEDDSSKLYIRAEIEWLDEPEGELEEEHKQRLEVAWMDFLEVLGHHNGMPEEILQEWKNAQLSTVNEWDAAALWRLASVMLLNPDDKQSLLLSDSISEMAEEILHLAP